MLKTFTVCAVALFSFTLFGCGGSSKSTTDQSDSNKGSQGQTKQNDKSNSEAQKVTLTFSQETRLPDDFAIPQSLQFVGIANYENSPAVGVGFKTDKPLKEVAEELKSALMEKGWAISKDKILDREGEVNVYKSSQDITSLHRKKWPKDTRYYMVTYYEEQAVGEKLCQFMVTQVLEPLKAN